MKIGVLWKSFKAHEKRYPLYWKHLNELSKNELNSLYFEVGYPNLDKVKHPVQILSRKDIFKQCDVVILIKPDSEDYKYFRKGQTIWGWTHTVQNYDITDIAICNQLTLIAFANMFKYHLDVKKGHVFARNNELAGYAAVNHFFSLEGLTAGIYGPHQKTAVLGFGAVARGAVQALLGLGATDITVFSKRSKFELVGALKNIKYKTYTFNDNKVMIEGNLAAHTLLGYDIIVNAVLQNPTKPMMFLNSSDITEKKPMIIDVSCDEGMGFDFAKPTTFEQPIIKTDKFIYYAVDHAPSHFFEAASYEISGALMPYLKYVIAHNTFEGSATLEKAMDIKNGHIINKKVINFQNRQTNFPHKIKKK